MGGLTGVLTGLVGLAWAVRGARVEREGAAVGGFNNRPNENFSRSRVRLEIFLTGCFSYDCDAVDCFGGGLSTAN